MNSLCKLDLHRPLLNHRYYFTDTVSGKSVYKAECSCGKKWMTDSTKGYFGFKVKRNAK